MDLQMNRKWGQPDTICSDCHRYVELIYGGKCWTCLWYESWSGEGCHDTAGSEVAQVRKD